MPQEQSRTIIPPGDPYPIDDPRPRNREWHNNLNGFHQIVGARGETINLPLLAAFDPTDAIQLKNELWTELWRAGIPVPVITDDAGSLFLDDSGNVILQDGVIDISGWIGVGHPGQIVDNYGNPIIDDYGRPVGNDYPHLVVRHLLDENENLITDDFGNPTYVYFARTLNAAGAPAFNDAGQPLMTQWNDSLPQDAITIPPTLEWRYVTDDYGNIITDDRGTQVVRLYETYGYVTYPSPEFDINTPQLIAPENSSRSFLLVFNPEKLFLNVMNNRGNAPGFSVSDIYQPRYGRSVVAVGAGSAMIQNSAITDSRVWSGDVYLLGQKRGARYFAWQKVDSQ